MISIQLWTSSEGKKELAAIGILSAIAHRHQSRLVNNEDLLEFKIIERKDEKK